MNEPDSTLLIAVIQAQDTDSAEHALQQLKITPERLPSVGGFLGRRNTTLLITVSLAKRQAVLDALHKSCRQRIEYIAVPLESAPLPLPTPTPISIGGATIFGLDIEHYEEI
jgi:uncharacterized protein YaaQ